MSEANKAQIDCWNGRAGLKWAKMQQALDAMLTVATEELNSRVGSVSGQRVLDIGCGTGETCEIWLNGGAEVTGVDVSEPMLAVAAERTGGKATLVKADAANWMGEAPFDLAVSRFGLMFFDDPDTAFATIAANIRPGGRLLFTCWRNAGENEWVSKPMGAVRDLLGPPSPPTPHAPGPFALCDRGRLEGILARAGFVDVSIDSFDFPVCMATEGGVESAIPFIMQIGPTGAALAETSEETKAVAAERLKTALASDEENGRLNLGGAIWFVDATRAG